MSKVSLTLKCNFLWDHLESFMRPSSLTGDTGKNVSVGNITNIHVSGTNQGCIGGKNNYTVTGGLSLLWLWCSEVIVISEHEELLLISHVPGISAGRIPAKSNVGNISNVTVGNNSGSIGSLNRINISWGKKESRIYCSHWTLLNVCGCAYTMCYVCVC